MQEALTETLNEDRVIFLSSNSKLDARYRWTGGDIMVASRSRFTTQHQTEGQACPRLESAARPRIPLSRVMASGEIQRPGNSMHCRARGCGPLDRTYVRAVCVSSNYGRCPFFEESAAQASIA